MSDKEINATLAARLKLMGLSTAYENAPFTPVSNVLYLAENYLPAPTDSPTISIAGHKDYLGIYQVSVCAPKGAYKLDAYTTAQDVQAQFPRGLVLTSGAVKVLVERTFISPAFTSGDRFIIAVSVQYRSIQ